MFSCRLCVYLTPPPPPPSHEDDDTDRDVIGSQAHTLTHISPEYSFACFKWTSRVQNVSNVSRFSSELLKGSIKYERSVFVRTLNGHVTAFDSNLSGAIAHCCGRCIVCESVSTIPGLSRWCWSRQCFVFDRVYRTRRYWKGECFCLPFSPKYIECWM